MSQKPFDVAVVIPAMFRDMVQGIVHFAFPGQRWQVRWFAGYGGTNPADDVRSRHFDGLIVLEDRPNQVRDLTLPDRPIVLLCNGQTHPALPSVDVDNPAVGQIAAHDLLNRGFQHLAVCGTFTTIGFSTERCQAFIKTVQDTGKKCLTWQLSSATQPGAAPAIEQWLLDLPKPVGIFCDGDWVATIISNCCHKLALRVPDDVAILGAGNDELLCQLTYPSLSSVIVPHYEIGCQAAQLLDSLMKHQAAPTLVRLPPQGIITRASTDLLAINDPEIVAVLRFIRDHAHHPITVDDILRHVPLSRRTMERKFQTLLQRSPLEEIHRVRLEQAKLLLAQTDRRIPDVAQASGFADPRRFATVFRQDVGCTPGAYRRRYRTPDDAPPILPKAAKKTR